MTFAHATLSMFSLPMFIKLIQVTTILVEPNNSGTAIIDKLGYMLQEEGLSI
jgi:hypothetical protein